MKRNYFVLLVLAAALFSLVGCNGNVSEIGKVNISIDSSIPKGIESISMDTVEYHIVMKKGSSSEDVVLDTVVPLSNAAYEGSFPVGNYIIAVYALNIDGLVIGSGTQDCTVTTGANSVTVNVHETTGDGTFKVSIQGNEGYTLKLQLFNADGSEVFSSDLTYADGKYVAEENLGNGFYRFTITRTDTNKVLIMDTCRIVAGYTTGLEAKFTLESDGTLEIINNIVKTPKITLSLSAAMLTKEESLTASAVVEDLKDYTCFWVVDGTKQGDAGSFPDLLLNMSAFGEGEHTVSFFVVKNSIVWSETKTFTVVDCITSIEVEGEVEFWVVGDVLVPYELEVHLFANDVERANYKVAWLHSVIFFNEKSVLTCTLKGIEGYSYYFDVQKNDSKGRTVVYIVIDRDIPNCGYIDFSFTQRFVLGDSSTRAAYIDTKNTQIGTGFGPYGANNGLVNVVNGMSNRRIKVEPDTYSFHGTTCGSNDPYYNVNVSPSSVVVGAEEAASMVLTHRPYSTVRFEFPEDVSGLNFFGYANGDAFYNLSEGNGFTAEFGTGDYKFELYRTDNQYEYKFVATANLVDGENSVNLAKEAISYEDTAVTVGTSRYSVEIDSNGFAFPENLKVLYRIKNGSSEEYGKLGVFDSIPQKENSVVGGTLGICLVREGSFAIEAASSIEGDVTRIVLKLVLANDVEPAIGNLVYDFDFTDEYSGKCPIIWLDNERYLIELSGKPTAVKLIPGAYRRGGSHAYWGGNNDKWVFVKTGFTAVSRQEVVIHLVSER